MVNQVQDRSSLFGFRIQRILQRRGQELVGIIFLIFSLAWSFVLLLSTYGSFFAKSILVHGFYRFLCFFGQFGLFFI